MSLNICTMPKNIYIMLSDTIRKCCYGRGILPLALKSSLRLEFSISHLATRGKHQLLKGISWVYLHVTVWIRECRQTKLSSLKKNILSETWERQIPSACPSPNTHTHTHTVLTASGCFLLFPPRREVRRNYRAILLTDAWLSIESL